MIEYVGYDINLDKDKILPLMDDFYSEYCMYYS